MDYNFNEDFWMAFSKDALTQGMRKRYTLCILFDRSRTNVLLIKKRKGVIYEELLNGIGGHIEESDDTPLTGAIREVGEEAGHCLDRQLKWLTTMIFPPEPCLGCSKRCKGKCKGSCLAFKGKLATELHVFYGVVSESKVAQLTDEQLMWVSVDNIYNNPEYVNQLAGDGNLQYFVRASLVELQKEDNNVNTRRKG